MSDTQTKPAEIVPAKADARPRNAVRRVRRGGVRSLDRVIHERLRLGIISALAVNESLTFNELKDILEISDGNLSDHSRKLENAGYIQVVKGYEGRKPQTVYRLTAKGKHALKSYVATMQELIRQASQSL